MFFEEVENTSLLQCDGDIIPCVQDLELCRQNGPHAFLIFVLKDSSHVSHLPPSISASNTLLLKLPSFLCFLHQV